MSSPYTRVGPFNDGAAPYLDADNLNLMDGALAAVPAVAAPDPTGVAATDTANLQNAMSTANANGQSFQFRAGTYKINAGLTWDCTKGSLIGMAGTVIDASAMTSGAAFTLDAGNTSSSSFQHRSSANVVGRFQLIGPDTDATTVDGFYINDSNGADNLGLEHIYTYGFRDVLSFGNNTWATTCLKVVAGHFHRYGVYLPAMTNSGENQNFIGCDFYSSSGNGGGTATAVKVTGNVDATFIACSFDYNGYEADIEAGSVRYFGCHFENSTTANNMVRVQQGVANSARTVVDFHSCHFALTEAAPGNNRAIVEIMSGSGSKVHVSWFGGDFQPYNMNYRLYVNNSTATPRIRHDSVYLDVGGPAAIPTVGDVTNMVAYPGFEGYSTFAAASPAYAGWYHQGSVTYTIDTGNPRTGTNALKMVGANGGSATACWQNMPVPAGPRQFLVTAWMACTAYTSGSVTFRVQWLAGDGSTTLRTDTVGQNSGAISAVQGYTPYAALLTPPAGTASALVVFYCSSNFAGTVYADDIGIWEV